MSLDLDKAKTLATGTRLEAIEDVSTIFVLTKGETYVMYAPAITREKAALLPIIDDRQRKVRPSYEYFKLVGEQESAADKEVR